MSSGGFAVFFWGDKCTDVLSLGGLLVGDCVLILECGFFECSYRGGNVE